MRRKFLITLIFLAVLAPVAGYGQGASGTAGTSPSVADINQPETLSVNPYGLDPVAGGTDCIVNAHSTARIGASAKGVIDELSVERGDRVKAGQVVARLESSEERTRLALARLKAESDVAITAAKAVAETAQRRATRLIGLGQSRIVPKSDVEDAETQARTAAAEFEQAKLDQVIARQEMAAAEAAMERKTVRAPFDGVVTSRLMSKGELYNEQDPILVIAGVDPLFIETFLPIAERSRVREGAEFPIELENGQSVSGRVAVIDPVLDAATGTFGIRLEVPNPDRAIIAGQRCRVFF